MIHVNKKELQERTFVPYEITITVNSREEHDRLTKDFKELESIASGRWYDLKRKFTAVHQLAEHVLKHL